MSDQFPHGYVAGCLERETEFGTCCQPFAEAVNLYTDGEIHDLLDAGQGIAMLPFITSTRDQKSDGSCASEATTDAIHLSRSLAGAPFHDLSSLSLYHYVKGSKRSRGGSGSSIDGNLRHARDVGLLTEAIWPRSNGHMRTPSQDLMRTEAPRNRIDEFLDVNEQGDWHRELLTALLTPMPCPFGLRGHAVDGVGVLRDPRDPRNLRKLRIPFHNSWNGHPAPWHPWVCPEYPDIPGLGWVTLDEIEPRYGIFGVRSTTDAGVTA